MINSTITPRPSSSFPLLAGVYSTGSKDNPDYIVLLTSRTTGTVVYVSKEASPLINRTVGEYGRNWSYGNDDQLWRPFNGTVNLTV